MTTQENKSTYPSPFWILDSEKKREAFAAYAFILPTLIGFLVFVLGPILAAVYFSFTDYDIFDAPRWIGLDNFERMFSDRRLSKVAFNTFRFTSVSVIANVGLGLILGVAISRNLPAPVKYFFRTTYFFPVLVAYVFVSMIWQFLYQRDVGIINYYLGFMNIDPIPWLSRSQWAWISVIVVDVWKNVGFTMMLTVAGLQGIPTQYYEAAQIDGANALQQFRRITLPLLTPTLLFNVIIVMINALKVFDVIVVLTEGGPGDSTRSVVMYVYEKAFESFQMGYASAVAVSLFIVILLLTVTQLWLSNRWVHYDL